MEDISETSIKPEMEEVSTLKAEEGEMRGFKPSGFKSSFKPAAPALTPSATTPTEMNATEADTDGQSMEMDEDVDGDAMEDLDGEALDDVDGEIIEPAQEGDDMDGLPMDLEEEDMDGEPL